MFCTCRRKMISVNATVGFIGAGMMASAMIKGLTKANILTSKIVASDIDSGAEERITKELNGTFVPTNAEVVAACDVVFLAVKPNVVAKVYLFIHELIPIYCMYL